MASQTPDWPILLRAIPAVITQVDTDLRVICQFNAKDSGLETPPGQVFLPDHREELQTLVKEETPVRLDTRVTEPSIIWYRHHVRRIDSVPGLMISSLVVTRLKTAESNLEQVRRWFDAIMQNSTDAIAISTRGEHYDASQFIAGNQRLFEMTGYTLDEFRTMKPSQLLADEMKHDLDGRYRMYPANPGQSNIAEGWGKRKDGTVFPFERLLVRSTSDEAIIFVRDISGRKEREEEIIHARLQAEAALKARDTFIANMSHELRSPLNTMLGYVQLLMENPTLSPDVIEYLRHIEYSAEHLGRFIGDVLDLSRVEAGFDSLHPTICDVRNLLKRLGGMLDIQAKRKRLDFTIEVADDLPELIRLDEVKLKQILINLVDNAIKYTDSGTITVQVHAVEANRMRLHVIDTGRGISPTDHARMFAPYERAEAMEKVIPGSGLGLAITRRLVELIDGEIIISPGEECGTIVMVTLPYTDAPAPEFTRRELNVYSEVKHKILVVDDERIDRHVLVTFLNQRGFDVQEADTGIAALEMIAKDEPDLVFLDYRLPAIDGIETLRHIREQYHSLPVVAVTADMLPENRLRLLEVGCNDVIIKPYRFSTIAGVLARHLDVTSVSTPQDSKPVTHARPEIDLPERLLAVLPADLLRELYVACRAGDHATVREYLPQIEMVSPETAARIGALIDQFWTTKVADAIAPLLGKFG